MAPITPALWPQMTSERSQKTRVYRYVISTNEVNKDPISSAVFRRISNRTGGRAYWAKTWQKQVEAFEAIREDLGNSYTVTYYPAPNPNEGFRKIDIQIVSDTAKHFRVRSRPGYRPRVN